ncbi:MAG: 6-hydroxymethylpterin diphosphokinase MptE-like protein [Campylobacterota bacterium]|nr:6-hydroxymethylpterin diphosphokinase MptE-like protein [Campylobacterota bacterium]
MLIAELEKNYQDNLQLFKMFIPSIYKLLEENKDDSYAIEINNDDINISKDGKLIYPTNTKNYFNNLLKSYDNKGEQNISRHKVSMVHNDNSLNFFGVETIHKKYLLNITKNYKSIFHTLPLEKREVLKQDFIYSGIIYGIGLGYHIMPLIKKYKFRHLNIVDVSIEMLRVSLYTIKWTEIFQYFLSDNTKSFSIIVQKDNDFDNLSKIVVKKLYEYNPLSYYNLGEFISYDDKKIYEVKAKVKTLNNIIFKNRGFFDDEKWGLQHTINSLKSNIPILTKNSIQVDKNKFVFVIGNGPSLDSYIRIIKKYRDNAMVVASGTAINSLYSYGVVPDIYVATERTIGMYSDITQSLPEKYISKITFIGMNTLHPRLFAQFKKKFMFLKSKDTGTGFINNERYRILNYSNPTVTNGALSLIISLGFKNICLFGMDFGYKDRKNHHSKNSIYLDKSHKYSKLEFKDEIEVEGVDGDTIYTQEIYNNSKKIIEELIKNSSKDINIYNFSNGAKIYGTKRVIKAKDIKLHKQKINKKKIFKEITKQFILYDNDIIINYKSISDKIKNLQNLIEKHNKKDITVYQLFNLFDIFYKSFLDEFSDKKLKYIITLLTGSIESIISSVYTFISRKEYNKDVSTFINISLKTFIELLEDVKNSFVNIENHIDTPFKWREQ